MQLLLKFWQRNFERISLSNFHREKIGKILKDAVINQILATNLWGGLANHNPTEQNLEKFGKMQLLTKFWQRTLERVSLSNFHREKIGKILKNADINQILATNYWED